MEVDRKMYQIISNTGSDVSGEYVRGYKYKWHRRVVEVKSNDQSLKFIVIAIIFLFAICVMFIASDLNLMTKSSKGSNLKESEQNFDEIMKEVKNIYN